jgi:hypothetical protein
MGKAARRRSISVVFFYAKRWRRDQQEQHYGGGSHLLVRDARRRHGSRLARSGHGQGEAGRNMPLRENRPTAAMPTMPVR